MLAVRVAVLEVRLRLILHPRLDQPRAIGQLRLQEVIPRALRHWGVVSGPRLAQHEQRLPGRVGIARCIAIVLRPAAIGPEISAHGVNPASQAVLSRIPAMTLAESYAEGSAYQYVAAYRRAAETVMGADLADAVERTLLLLEDTGLGGLDDTRKDRLRTRFATFDHPAAREIIAWLDGAFVIGADELQTQ